MLEIKEHVSLKNYNTFRIDAKARFLVEVKSEEEFTELLKHDLWKQHEHFFLGGGANVLFTKDFDGIVIKNNILGKEILKEQGDDIYIKVGSGESWPALVHRCVDHGYQGLENLALIPGTVGGSAVGNIGAYGTEAKDVIDKVEYRELKDEEMKKLRNEECGFGYRESIFKHELKNKVFITAVIFRLKKTSDIDAVKKRVGEIIEMRKAKLPDPAQTGTAGSFFKNPVISHHQYHELQKKYPNLISFPAGEQVKLAAGQLIELCGLKGYKHGNAGVSEQHALILINTGNCTGQEVVELADHIISEVKKNFGVTLDPEVMYV